MRKILTALITAGTIGIASVGASTSADAQWRGGWGWGGVGVGLAAGAIIGSAIAANAYNSSGYYNGYPAEEYHPAYGDYSHAYDPAYGYNTATTYAPGYNYGDPYAEHPYGSYSTYGYGAPVHPYAYGVPGHPYVGYRLRHYARHYVHHY